MTTVIILLMMKFHENKFYLQLNHAISNVCVETPDYPICGNIYNMSVEVSKKEHKSLSVSLEIQLMLLENCFTKDNFVPEGTTLS